MIFPTFFDLRLNVSVRSSWSEPHSAPSLVFAVYVELLHLGCKGYNQSDFSIDHLVTSMCRVVSCVVGRRCLLWSVSSFGKSLLAFPLLHLRPNLPVSPDICWLPTFALQFPIMKRTSFFGVSFKRSYRSS